MKQRGVVLFFALVALVAMSLAAVALIRSVDTSTMIAGNLAFKQSAVSSGEAGLESAIEAMAQMNSLMETTGKNVLMDADHVFNVTDMAAGYYSNAPLKCSSSNLPSRTSTVSTDIDCNTDTYGKEIPIKWDDTDSVLVWTDSSGNEVRYIAQRLCRNENEKLSTGNCLLSGADLSNGPQGVPLASKICDPAVSPGCPKAGQAAQYRITARVAGPRNTVSYIQSFVY